jgi:hypothetical protein
MVDLILLQGDFSMTTLYFSSEVNLIENSEKSRGIAEGWR